MNRRKTRFVYDDLPKDHYAFVHKRVLPLVQHYGQCIAGMEIMTLAMSCYHQCVSDFAQLGLVESRRNETDYQI